MKRSVKFVDEDGETPDFIVQRVGDLALDRRKKGDMFEVRELDLHEVKVPRSERTLKPNTV